LTHAIHRIHENSLDAFYSERIKLGARAKHIYDWLYFNGPATDREVMHGLNYIDGNCVKPRITELIDKGLVTERDRIRCPVTHRMVRRVGVVTDNPMQMELPC
jgi:hypothetical protein